MISYKGLKKSKDDAVWQYILDHATPCKDGYRITFFVSNRGHWEGKIRHRMNGNYRNDERLLEEELRDQCEEFIKIKSEHKSFKLTLDIANTKNQKKDKKFDRIYKSNKWMDKFMLFLYKKSKDYILK